MNTGAREEGVDSEVCAILIFLPSVEEAGASVSIVPLYGARDRWTRRQLCCCLPEARPLVGATLSGQPSHSSFRCSLAPHSVLAASVKSRAETVADSRSIAHTIILSHFDFAYQRCLVHQNSTRMLHFIFTLPTDSTEFKYLTSFIMSSGRSSSVSNSDVSHILCIQFTVQFQQCFRFIYSCKISCIMNNKMP